MASLSSNAPALAFVTGDGYTAKVTFAEVQVKGVVEIQVKLVRFYLL